MVVFQKLEGKTTTLNFWSQKLEGKTTTLIFWNQKLKGKTTTPKNCVLTNFLHERSTIFFLVFSLVWFWILLRNVNYSAKEIFDCFLIFKGDLVCFMMFPHTEWVGLLFMLYFNWCIQYVISTYLHFAGL